MRLDQPDTPIPNKTTSRKSIQKWSDRLLLLSGIILWGSLLGTIGSYVLAVYGNFEGQGDYLTPFVMNVQFHEFLNLSCVGIALLLIYTLWGRFWLKTHRYTVNYWLQIMVALVMLTWVIKVFIFGYGTEEVVVHPIIQSAPAQ